MKFRPLRLIFLLTSVALGTLAALGCGRQGTTPAPGQASLPTAAGEHGHWWCPEHGVPEEECSMCSKKAAVEFKKKGDWCKEHDRAESQCFICEPARSEKFAALYEAKYGKKPPTPEDNIGK
jgi:hypothetical protein